MDKEIEEKDEAETMMTDNTPTPEAEAAKEAEEAAVGEGASLISRVLAALPEDARAALYAALARRRAERAAEREEEKAIAEMEGEAAFSDIRAHSDAVHALISRVEWLRALPPRERLAAALYLDRGMRLCAPEKKEEEGAARTVTPTVRGGRMPANVKKAPQTLAEAGEAAKQYFKIRK